MFLQTTKRGSPFSSNLHFSVMTKNNHITAPDDCSGCGLCANVCSRNAITLQWNEDGFLAPTVDTSACINCGLCVKKCPALNPPQQTEGDMENVISYGGWSNDKTTRRESSSGGVFTPLAVQTIKNGGVVFGVVWKDKLTAVFDKAETIEELRPMRGSKYINALPGNVYRQVKEQLKTGRHVLFAGTGCHVWALKKYLGKDYENLLLVDILCHGTPSHLILRKYVQEAEDSTKKMVDYVSFRDKSDGWKDYHVRTYYTDGTSESHSHKQDYFMKIFLSDKALNRSCYACKFRQFPRISDITLGDYWGVAHPESEWPISDGISAILANTEKGQAALHSIGKDITLKAEPFPTIYRGQAPVYQLQEKPIPESRNQFLHLLKTAPLKKVYSKVLYAVDFGFVHISYRSGLYKLWKKIFKK